MLNMSVSPEFFETVLKTEKRTLILGSWLQNFLYNFCPTYYKTISNVIYVYLFSMFLLCQDYSNTYPHTSREFNNLLHLE